ncbi:hypothetical protein ES703_79197 [subsurface metagenome]
MTTGEIRTADSGQSGHLQSPDIILHGCRADGQVKPVNLPHTAVEQGEVDIGRVVFGLVYGKRVENGEIQKEVPSLRFGFEVRCQDGKEETGSQNQRNNPFSLHRILLILSVSFNGMITVQCCRTTL